MYDSQSVSDEAFAGEDPLGPVAVMTPVSFGAREAALAGVGAGNRAEDLSAAMFTWHITCSSITLASGGDPT
jgi:hypothetical protein